MAMKATMWSIIYNEKTDEACTAKANTYNLTLKD
jgi:hypothetical protein